MQALRRLLTLLLAPAGAVLLLLCAAPAGAVVPLQTVVPSGSGLSVPSGAAVTPDGALWVADDEHGICRVRTSSPGLVADPVWCPLSGGGANAIAGTGQIAFDASTNHLYVAEADSAAGGVWRLRWDPGSGRIVDGGKIVDTPEDLVTGLAVGYTGPPAYPGGPLTAEVNFTSKRTETVRRVRAPASAAPTVVTVGFRRFTGEEEVGSIAALGHDLYLAEPFGVTRLTTVPGETPRAQLIPGLDASFPGGVPSALAIDQGRRRLYAGTDNGNARDQVDVLDLDTGRHETYAVGVAAALAIAIDAAGDLLVVDDPGEAAEADVENQARIWRARFAPVGRPGTTITAAPPTFTRTPDVSFDFTAAPGATFECLFDAMPWTACGGVGSGGFARTGLAEGTHVFAVRAVDPDPAVGLGPERRRTFVIDMTPPVVTIDNPDSDREPANGDFTLRFSGNEPNLDFSCTVTGEELQPCSPSTHRFRGLEPGWHTARVRAVDPAGNESEETPESSFRFFVRPPAQPSDRDASDDAAPVVARLALVEPRIRAPRAARRGEARLSARRGRRCAGEAFRVSVRGSWINRVGFRIDGRRIAIVRDPDSRGRFAVRVRRGRSGRHVVTALVRFARGAGSSERLRHEFTACAKPKHIDRKRS